jgi:hypothetical protein
MVGTRLTLDDGAQTDQTIPVPSRRRAMATVRTLTGRRDLAEELTTTTMLWAGSWLERSTR